MKDNKKTFCSKIIGDIVNILIAVMFNFFIDGITDKICEFLKEKA